MREIKVVTYCTWTSIGSMLQALGLRSALLELGHTSTICLDAKDNTFSRTRIHSVKSLARRAFEILIHADRKAAFHKRMRFISNQIDIAEYSSVKELADDVDGYLAGSDQIWNPDHCNPLFFLDFAPNKKRISYAASMGKTEVPCFRPVP